ncbi:MAG TPA: zinc ribbon domain-containing protein [Ktedonobacterales bacterium]|nr:zinc ribbon domain-containing protein [Ktedonobacterales bacterium]
MSFGGPSKTCPRCNSVLPASATFCGTCGLQFSAPAAPSAPPYAPTQYAGGSGYPPQSGPSYPPPSGPGYAPQGAPGYPPPAQPGYAGYPAPGQPPYPGGYPAPGAPPAKKGGAGRAIILVLVLVVLVGGGAAAWFLYLNPAHPGSPLFDRHGLPSNVPLPNGTSFSGLQKTFTSSQDNVTVSANAWGWTVSGSNAVTVQKFYQDNLSSNGWTKIHPLNGDNGEKDVYGCQSNQILIIGASDTKLEATDSNGHVTDTVTAPSGGSALITELSSSPALVQLLCSNTPILPTP